MNRVVRFLTVVGLTVCFGVLAHAEMVTGSRLLPKFVTNMFDSAQSIPVEPQINFSTATNTGNGVTAYSLYYKSGSQWLTASNQTEAAVGGLLGVARGTNSLRSGMLTGGEITYTGWTFTVGSKLYVSATPGAIATTAPTNTDAYLRCIGYATDSNAFYLSPDTIWTKIGQLTGIESDIDVLQTATGTLNTAVTTLNTATGTLNTAVTALNTATGTLDTAVTALNTATGTLNTAVTALNTATGTLNTAVTALNTATGVLDTAVTALNTATGTLDTAVTALNTATGVLDTAVTTLNTATNTINARFVAFGPTSITFKSAIQTNVLYFGEWGNLTNDTYEGP